MENYFEAFYRTKVETIKVCNLSNNNAMKQNKRNRYERNISNKFLFGKRISKKIFLLKEIDMKR